MRAVSPPTPVPVLFIRLGEHKQNTCVIRTAYDQEPAPIPGYPEIQKPGVVDTAPRVRPWMQLQVAHARGFAVTRGCSWHAGLQYCTRENTICKLEQDNKLGHRYSSTFLKPRGGSLAV